MKRYAQDAELLRRRAREHRRFLSVDGESVVEAGRFRKRHPLDCGRPRCRLCHSEKLDQRRTPQVIRAEDRLKDGLADYLSD